MLHIRIDPVDLDLAKASSHELLEALAGQPVLARAVMTRCGSCSTVGAQLPANLGAKP